MYFELCKLTAFSQEVQGQGELQEVQFVQLFHGSSGKGWVLDQGHPHIACGGAHIEVGVQTNIEEGVPERGFRKEKGISMEKGIFFIFGPLKI